MSFIDIVRTRISQKYRTIKYPAAPPPELPPLFAGRPIIDRAACQANCQICLEVCPVKAIYLEGSPNGASANASGAAGIALDTGKCLFCRACEAACPQGAIHFTREYRLASSDREALVVRAASAAPPAACNQRIQQLFGRSLKLRQVSAGGCNACEADTNVLSTVGWDLERFGIQFVASPRHADGILITGPVSENMRLALLKTYAAVADPRVVIVVGSCAIAGGPYIGHAEVHNGAADLVPVDLYIPGCPPHPLSILDGLLRLLGRVKE